jgi:putative ABC transport system permease protein
MVMGILFKKLIRDINEAKGQFISILVIVMLGVMFYSGINATFRNLSGASIKYYREYRLADVWADIYKAPESMVDRIKSLSYVKMATGRIVQDTKINISGINATARLITLPDQKEDIVNDIILKSGRYFSESESSQCLVEEEFYKAHGLKPGDYISPVINGNVVKLKVIGSVKSPEYVYVLKDGSELVPDNAKFGIVYIKKSFGQAIFGFEGSINSISAILANGTDIGNAKDDIKKMLKNYSVINVYSRDNQISSSMLDQEMKGLQSMGGTFPVAFFIVAAVIIYIMMARMIENQRTQIGVLKAFGFSNLKILAHYLSYSFFIAVVGSILGSILGMYLGIGFTNLENAYFHLPPADMKIYSDLVLPASCLTLFFCLLAGYNACKLVLKIMPSEAMRPKAPKIGKRILVEKIEILWRSLNYTWRIILRNVFRYKRRALMTSIGVVFSTAILLIAFSMKDSIDFMVNQQYENIQNYDIKVNFSRFINDEELTSIKNIPHVTELEPIIETGVEISNGWIKKNIGFTALINEPKIYKVTDKNGVAIELPQQGILIPEKLAEILNVKPNDIVYIKSFLPGRDKKAVRVKGIVAQYIGLNAYSSIDNAEKLLSDDFSANAAVLKIDSSAYEKEVKNRLDDITTVSTIQSKSDSMNNFLKNMASMTASMGVMIVLAAILSIAVVYNIATINIFERQRELATLKVLGFKDGEVKKLVFNENYLITAFGIILGLPMGYWLGGLMMSANTTEAYSIPFVASVKTYILSAVLTLAFTALANFILTKKIKSISMVEVLKSNE